MCSLLSGKLHRHIVQLQVSEGTAVKKLEDSMKRITKLQAQLLRMEQRLDEKDQGLLHHRAESANKSRHLRYSSTILFCNTLDLKLFIVMDSWLKC